MILTVRQKTNIRHFIYYLVNGTLDFELLNNKLSINYHEHLEQNPELFYKACCVFINHECENQPDWPDVKRLGSFLYQEIQGENSNQEIYFAEWELNFQNNNNDLAGSFKAFAYWFSIVQFTSQFIDSASYSNFISDGASFSEQCFAIWANVITLENNIVQNQDQATEKVKEYIKSYYLNGYESNLADWEYELH